MNSTSVHVKICESNECVYENNSVELSTNTLTGVISCLKDMQIKINDFITILVKKQDGSIYVESK